MISFCITILQILYVNWITATISTLNLAINDIFSSINKCELNAYALRKFTFVYKSATYLVQTLLAMKERGEVW